MQVAGNENSGGYRPTAKQNNPANISATGGNGQAGNVDYSGFAYGENQQLNETRKAMPLKNQTPNVPTVAPSDLSAMMGAVEPLDAEPTNFLPVTDGVDFGRGRGSEALPGKITNPINQNPNVDLIKRYLPDLMNATRLQGAPDSYRRFVNYLKEQIM